MTARLTKKKYPSDLSIAQWEILKPLIPEAKHGGRPRAHPMIEIINAIFYKARTGCQWRQLPNDYPPWRTVYEYFRNWTLDDTWQIIHNEIVKIVRKKNQKKNLHQLQLLIASLSKQQLQEKKKDLMEERKSKEEKDTFLLIRLD